MSCILRVSGKNLDIEKAIELFSDPSNIWNKGSRNRRGEVLEENIVTWVMSDADFDQLDLQIEEVIELLVDYQECLDSLMKNVGVESAYLDFGYATKEVAIQGEYLEPKLLRLAGNLGIGILLSRYPEMLESEGGS